MRIVILVKEKKDGLKLQQAIIELRPGLKGVSYYTKDEITRNQSLFSDTEIVFSTWYMPTFSEEEIKKIFPSLRVVFYAAGTVKYFAEPFLNNGVRVFSSAKANGISVAEFVTAQIILANKGYFQAQKANKSFLWRFAFRKASTFAENRPGNYHAKVGLLGCGRIGTEVVRLLKPFKVEVFIYDPYVSEERCRDLGVTSLDLQTLFETSDVISNHLPNIPSTQNIINYDLLRRMKDYSTFINTGRGAQVVEEDLAKLLRKRPTICALLDVSKHEPPFPWSPLLRRKNLFLTPHIAGSMGNEYLRMVEYALHAYDDYIQSKYNDMEVKKEMLSQMA